MSDTYKARRQSIEDRYLAQQEARQIAKERQEEVMESQLETLAKQRESANRDAYVRQQQQLTALPEELAAYGINGGGAETSLLKIHTEYNKARDRIRSDYESSAGEIEQSRRTLESEYAAGLAEDRADYYDRLAQLAADIAEAQAQEQARREEQALAWAKLQQEERLAMAKLEASNNKTTNNQKTEGSDNKNPGDTEEEKDSARQAKMLVSGSVGTLTEIGGQKITNQVRYDGSGQYYIVVGGQAMTPEELQKARLQGKVTAIKDGSGVLTYQLRAQGEQSNQQRVDRWLTLQGLRK